MHICINKISSICSDNSLSPVRHQAIIQTNANCWLDPKEQHSEKFQIEIQTFSFKEMYLKMSAK